jgi:hypothetical protein
MPAVPYREDDDARVAPARSSHPQPRAVRWSAEEFDTVADRPPQRHPEPHAPALEGLTTTGASIVGLVGTTFVAVVDSLVSPGLGWIFFLGFLAMSAFVGLRLRRRDAWASFGVPPLVFISAAGIAAQVAPVVKGSWLDRTSGDMATAVLDHPFMLLIGTALSVGAFIYRGLID